jgi:hypothetical protein
MAGSFGATFSSFYVSCTLVPMDKNGYWGQDVLLTVIPDQIHPGADH